MMKFRSTFCVFLQFLVYVHLLSNEIIDKPASQYSQEYDNDFVELVEMVYGDGLLSQGGMESIDEMFHGINLNDLKVLDLGSGLGMCDIYLAKNFNVQITGIDPQNKLIQKANQHLQVAQKDLMGSVSFSLMKDPNNLNQFEDNFFDIIYSKESILHVPHEVKESYFKEIYRVLKPGGQIIIMDWMHSGIKYSENTKKMMEMDGLFFQLLTPQEYQSILKKTGFKNIELVDITSNSVQISQQNIDTIMQVADKIIRRFGADSYKYSLDSWAYQKDAFKNRELLAGILKATKT
ncbi:Methyltransferase domain protein [Chlamydiales bacterium STE3]|nr:Methyltransferase domain protein [Chlamydiales bacterium STE3]